MADIFVSYGRKDSAFVGRLVTQLKNRGYSVWWDTELVSGVAFARVIEKEVHEAQYALVIWSKASVGSHWVYAEAELARRLGKLRQIALDGVSPPLPFGALHVEHVSRRADDDAALQALASELFGDARAVQEIAPKRLAASRFLFKKMAPELLLSSLGFVGVGVAIAGAMTDLVGAQVVAPLLYGVISLAASSGLFTAVRLVSMQRLGR